MKKNILFFAMSATLLMSSCSDFLDVQPEGDATTTTYFTNDLQAIDAVDALYERFHQEAVYGRELFGNKVPRATLCGERPVIFQHLLH